MSNQSTYRSALKGTAIFGGVQIINVLISIARGKLIALLLGPAGMGIISLYTSTTNMIYQFSSLGLSLSGVKTISEANEINDNENLGKIILIFRKWVLFTGIIAAIITVIGSPLLSKFTFGNYDHTWGFVALSIMLFFTAMSSAEVALLQGTRRLRHLAKASVIGSITGLIVGIPLYYFFGVQGIVPAMIILAAATYATNRYYTKKISLSSPKMSLKDIFQQGKHMASLGIVLMIATLIGTITTYMINIYIRTQGNLDDVGFYQAATSISTQYVGLIFASMAMDYFPRLAAVSTDNLKIQKTANNQLDIIMLLITPILIAFIITAPTLVRILLSDSFSPVIPLLRWLVLGIFFKALAYPVGYISFAKGDKKFFFWLEGVYSNLMTLLLSYVSYTLWGLNGLGISFTVSFVLYLIIILIFTKNRYNFSLEKQSIKTITPLLLAVFISFIIFQFEINDLLSYIISIITFIVISIYSYKKLDKLIGIKELIISKLKD